MFGSLPAAFSAGSAVGLSGARTGLLEARATTAAGKTGVVADRSLFVSDASFERRFLYYTNLLATETFYLGSWDNLMATVGVVSPARVALRCVCSRPNPA